MSPVFIKGVGGVGKKIILIHLVALDFFFPKCPGWAYVDIREMRVVSVTAVMSKTRKTPYIIIKDFRPTIVGLIPEKNPNLHEKRGDKFQTQNLWSEKPPPPLPPRDNDTDPRSANQHWANTYGRPSPGLLFSVTQFYHCRRGGKGDFVG